MASRWGRAVLASQTRASSRLAVASSHDRVPARTRFSTTSAGTRASRARLRVGVAEDGRSVLVGGGLGQAYGNGALPDSALQGCNDDQHGSEPTRRGPGFSTSRSVRPPDGATAPPPAHGPQLRRGAPQPRWPRCPVSPIRPGSATAFAGMVAGTTAGGGDLSLRRLRAGKGPEQ